MPVEIKELKIKAVITPPESENKFSDKGKITRTEIERMKREIKRECIDELKQFINDQKER